MASATPPTTSIWVFRLPQKATAHANFSQGRLAAGASNMQATVALRYEFLFLCSLWKYKKNRKDRRCDWLPPKGWVVCMRIIHLLSCWNCDVFLSSLSFPHDLYHFTSQSHHRCQACCCRGTLFFLFFRSGENLRKTAFWIFHTSSCDCYYLAILLSLSSPLLGSLSRPLHFYLFSFVIHLSPLYCLNIQQYLDLFFSFNPYSCFPGGFDLFFSLFPLFFHLFLPILFAVRFFFHYFTILRLLYRFFLLLILISHMWVG